MLTHPGHAPGHQHDDRRQRARHRRRRGSWGQRLYFNKDGQRAPLIAERLTDVKAKGMTANGEARGVLGEDANVLMLIQVPLKYRAAAAPAVRRGGDGWTAGGDGRQRSAPHAGAGEGERGSSARERADIDTAVLGHGPTEGPYTELDGLTIERDARFPVRVTVQFYQATSNGVRRARRHRARWRSRSRRSTRRATTSARWSCRRALDRQRPTNWDGVRRGPRGDRADFPGLMQRRQDAAKTGTN